MKLLNISSAHTQLPTYSSVNETALTVSVYGIPYLLLALTLVGVWVYKRRVRLTAQREAVQRYRREYGSIILP